MKKIIFSFLFIIYSLATNAQSSDTVLVQDFNTACASSSGTVPDWLYTNPITSTVPNGEWHCVPSEGRWSTPGIACTGVWGSPPMYHLDTAYLITPGLDISSHTGNVYLAFDTKTTNINLGGRLSIMAGLVDSSFGRTTLDTFNLTPSLNPIFTSNDSTDWVTHEVDLTPYKSFVPLYVAFVYTSTDLAGSTWYLDNIHTTIYPASTPKVIKYTLPLTLIGNSTRSEITFSYEIKLPGIYHLSVCDIMGRKVYEENIIATTGNTTYTISGLNLHSGMYFLKMGNGEIYGTAKTIIQ